MIKHAAALAAIVAIVPASGRAQIPLPGKDYVQFVVPAGASVEFRAEMQFPPGFNNYSYTWASGLTDGDSSSAKMCTMSSPVFEHTPGAHVWKLNPRPKNTVFRVRIYGGPQHSNAGLTTGAPSMPANAPLIRIVDTKGQLTGRDELMLLRAIITLKESPGTGVPVPADVVLIKPFAAGGYAPLTGVACISDPPLTKAKPR